ncbi:hypothetical protein LJR296_008002 [Cupriavidus necator]|uniref:DUF7673 family protein n=1 Tax=Cupriavidus necator TaxID=106590 RepID=UPI003ED049BD
MPYLKIVSTPTGGGQVDVNVRLPQTEVAAFLAHIEAFAAGDTPAQQAAEVQAQEQVEGMDALAALLTVAEGDSDQAEVVARLLVGLYNGQEYPFDLTLLRLLDAERFVHALAVLRMDWRQKAEVHTYFPNGSARWLALSDRYGLRPPPTAVPQTGRYATRYDGRISYAPDYRDVALTVMVDGGAEVELSLTAAAGEHLLRGLLELHQLAWSNGAPIDKRAGESRPCWLPRDEAE